jgi:hypothetical protein
MLRTMPLGNFTSMQKENECTNIFFKVFEVVFLPSDFIRVI